MIDKYFGANANFGHFPAEVAKAICSHCVVLEQCRDQALAMPELPGRGILAGVPVTQIRLARQWRRYESGMTDEVPSRHRPAWLKRTEATETAEQWRIETDQDEPPIER